MADTITFPNFSTGSQSQVPKATKPAYVFNPPVEIIEMIALFLPISRVFVVQRVSSKWKVAIEDSPKLQRALFRRPPLSADTACFEIIKTFTFNASIHVPDGSWYRGESDGLKPILNPLLRDFFYKKSDRRWDLSRFRYSFLRFPRIGNFRNGDPLESNTNALCKAGDSWRKMFVVQPPCKTLCYSYYESEDDGRLMSGKIENDLGVTMGDLVDHYMQLGVACTCLYIHGFLERNLKLFARSTPAIDIIDEIEGRGETTPGRRNVYGIEEATS